jgi:hypothetical protein
MISGRNYFALINEAANLPASAGTPPKINVTAQFNPWRSELKSAISIPQVVGVSGFLTVTFAGAYAVGDEVRLTITSNLTSRQAWRKSYTHTVQAGLTTATDIANAFTAMIQADVNNPLNSPYSAVSNVAGVMTVTQFDDDKQGLVSYTFTDSAAGTIVSVLTPTVISEGQPSDLIDKGIDAADILLANYTTVRITFHNEVAIPFIDSQGATCKEIFWYGTPAQAAALVALIP